MHWTRLLPLICTLMILTMPAAQAGGIEITNSGDDLRTGWYPNEPSITPQLVAGGSFGRLWSTPVEGQVYAQPLLDAGTLLVATEQNDVYGLNPASGAIDWTLKLKGTPFNPGEYSCADLAPSIGVTATPVIDPATHIAYLTHKGYVTGSSGASRWYMDAIDVTSGKEEPGFPVALEGSAQNAPGQSFQARTELQRPGLLLLEGVVYAAFGSDCDMQPWQGWVFGVSTAGAVRSRWVSVTSGSGAGIWQSGAGLTSDGPGTILLSTGNGGAPSTPTPGSSPPSNLGESIVRLRVQEDGSLKATDFFAPFDAASLDEWDADFASGGVTGLPGEYFGSAQTPHLAVAVGKDGYVYLLDRDHLGGIGQGPSGSDQVVQRVGPYGGVWSRPGVWPGEGGWIYIPTASGGTSAGGSSGNLRVYSYGLSGTGKPSLSLQGTSSDAFGFGSGAPVITSEGTTAGSALVWVVWTPNGAGTGAQLRAYDPTPVGGVPVLRFSAPVGTASKFSMPGVGAGRLYVGTRDGHVLGFGSPVTPVLSGAATAFPTTTLGEASERTLTLTASQPLTLSNLESSSAQFKLGEPSRTLPAALATGETIDIPISFAPTATGPQGATLTATTSTGAKASFALSGVGQATGPKLEVVPPLVTFGGTEVGGHLSAGATFRNVGGSPLTIEGVKLPSAPFGAEGAPAPGDQIQPGGSVTVTVTFDPSEAGTFGGQIELETDGGDEAIGLSGSAASPGTLHIAGESLDYGQVEVGKSKSMSFTIANEGGTSVTITKSKPPFGGAFEASTTLAEGTTIQPGQSLTETVSFKPGEAGEQSGVWQINGDGSSGAHEVSFHGSGFSPPPPGFLELASESIDFGDGTIGSSAQRSIALSNPGATPVTIEASDLSGVDFGPSHPLPAGTVLQAGATLTATVHFNPTAGGPRSGLWQIRADDGSGTHQVALTGFGTMTGGPGPQVELVQGPSIGPTLETLGTKEAKQPVVPDAELVGTALGAGPKRRIAVRVSCPAAENSCGGVIALRTRSRVRIPASGHKAARLELVTVASGSFEVPGGRTTRVWLHLSKHGLVLLTRARRMHLQANVLAHDEAGSSHTATALVRVLAEGVKPGP